uniref:TadE-like domain-containing protein n=1 Tax=Thermorudis peleae TaxID=1382356 RepID=A0A831TD85_9BACT
MVLSSERTGPRAARRPPSLPYHPGQALVELAVIAGFLLLLILALFEFGRAFTAWVQLGNMARAGAQYGSMGAFLSPSDDVDAIEQKMITAAMDELGSDHTIWGEQPVVTVSSILKDPDSKAEPGMGTEAMPECIAIVRVEYEFHPIFPVPGLPDSVRLSRTAQMRVQFRPWYDPTVDPAGGCKDVGT